MVNGIPLQELIAGLQELGLSNKQIAERAGVSESSVSRILRGETQRPWQSTQRKLLKVLEDEGRAPSPPQLELRLKEQFLDAAKESFEMHLEHITRELKRDPPLQAIRGVVGLEVHGTQSRRIFRRVMSFSSPPGEESR